LYYTLLGPPLRPLVLEAIQGRLGRDAVAVGVHSGQDSARRGAAAPAYSGDGAGPLGRSRRVLRPCRGAVGVPGGRGRAGGPWACRGAVGVPFGAVCRYSLWVKVNPWLL
jgi:hypothetical protein